MGIFNYLEWNLKIEKARTTITRVPAKTRMSKKKRRRCQSSTKNRLNSRNLRSITITNFPKRSSRLLIHGFTTSTLVGCGPSHRQKSRNHKRHLVVHFFPKLLQKSTRSSWEKPSKRQRKTTWEVTWAKMIRSCSWATVLWLTET